MASRENQGLQAALIVFVLITIALAVTTYIYFRQAEEEGARAIAAQQQAQENETAMRQAIDERNRLKEMLGFDMATEMAAIEEQFTKDMALFGADYPESDPKNYRQLPVYLTSAALKKHEATTDAENREQQALQAKTETEKRLNEEKAALEQQNQQMVTLYQDERQKLAQDRTQLNQQMQQVATTLRAKDQEIAAAKTESQQAAERYAAQISELEKIRESFVNQRREREDRNYETADGRITFVNPAQGTVLIDLGIADGLQRHVTFSVYDPNANEYSPEYAKGKIEVTKLLDRHLAEARVVEDDLSSPIIQGDLIYTPAWRPGTFMHFAVAGFIDVNGDGVEDKDLLRNIIQANGGVIDAEVDPSGNITGEITVSTRYLILGERPTEKTAAGDPNALNNFTTLYEDATRKGVELMPLERFLALIGYKAGAQTVQISGQQKANPSAQQPQGGGNAAQPGAAAQPAGAGGAEPFRARRPPRGENGAF